MYKKAEYAALTNVKEWPYPYIVQLSYPFVVGMPIVLERDDPKVESMLAQRNRGMATGKVDGFTVFIVPVPSLTGETIPKESLIRTMDEMADFYRENCILAGAVRHYRYSAENLEGFKAEKKAIRAERAEAESQKRIDNLRKKLFGDE